MDKNNCQPIFPKVDLWGLTSSPKDVVEVQLDGDERTAYRGSIQCRSQEEAEWLAAKLRRLTRELNDEEGRRGMPSDEMKKVLAFCLDVLNTGYPEVETARYDSQRLEDESCVLILSLGYLKFICIEAAKFVDEGRIEKAMRWLGFLQGVLWARGFYSLDDLKNHSRPDSPI
jgi:hypothetical protein